MVCKFCHELFVAPNSAFGLPPKNLSLLGCSRPFCLIHVLKHGKICWKENIRFSQWNQIRAPVNLGNVKPKLGSNICFKDKTSSRMLPRALVCWHFLKPHKARFLHGAHRLLAETQNPQAKVYDEENVRADFVLTADKQKAQTPRGALPLALAPTFWELPTQSLKKVF